MYAIVDIETTGGKYNEEGITEIAIYRYDGHKVTDKFISLVNPEKEIQAFVAKLTGINNHMLRNAPKFYEIAKRIVEITDDCILVAHNANFDNRILRTEFKRLGFDYQRKTLCTVELSKKLLPGKDSYSLGKLVRSLGIPVSDRHRANGDAMATVKLFKLLLSKDKEKKIIKESVITEIETQLQPKLLDIVEQLPSATGVFYIHNEDGEIIYIGKSKNIKRKVNKHFTSSDNKSKRIQNLVHAVTYEETGNELVSLLKEYEELRINKPMLNFHRKRRKFNIGLFKHIDESGLINLHIKKTDRQSKPSLTFTNIHEANNVLYKMAEEFTLCHKYIGLSQAKKGCYNNEINKCKGICVGEESKEAYNERVEKAIIKFTYPFKNMIIVDRGREVHERSAILIENNKFQGFGFYDLNHQISNPEILKNMITSIQNNAELTHIIQSYIRKRRVQKIIELQ
ncbi:exonuclease domain-containing protein [Ascidiimonas sp. W6]|uniref:exonuclease domain-containing protein n=1 Tax=Ascidiimonas meishanensis TaxID=3128903 RepID=UPI0030EDF9EC